MKELIYVTEPRAINMQELRKILPTHYELIEGNVLFEADVPEDITTVLIRSVTQIKADIKRTFPNLSAVIRVGTGLDNIDLEFCAAEGIQVYNSPGANADAVSDYIVCMTLTALRRVHTISEKDITEWSRFKFFGHSMSGQTIGLVGFGNVGKQVYSKLKGFGCGFIVYDPLVSKSSLPVGVEYVTNLDELLTKSSVVSLHVPLLEETKNLISRKNLHLMPDNAVLINASRGGIVNEDDVVEAVHSKNLTYVADTVVNEPNVSKVLLGSPNIIITPHIGSLTEESDLSMLRIAVENYLSMHPVKNRVVAAHTSRV